MKTSTSRLTVGDQRQLKVLTAMTSAASLGVTLAEWLLFPMLFYAFEAAWTLPQQITAVIILMTVLLLSLAVCHYADTALEERRDFYRTQGCTLLAHKAMTTSYPHIVDKAYRCRLEDATASFGRHINAPLAQQWATWSALATNGILVGLSFTVMLSWDIWVAMAAAVTSLISATVHRAVTGWCERQEPLRRCEQETWSTIVCAISSGKHIKDIRVFGLAPWLRDIRDAAGKAMSGLFRRRSWMCFFYNAVDTLLFVLRNAVCFAVLFLMTVNGELVLSAAVLCFLSVGVFSQSIASVSEGIEQLRASQKASRAVLQLMEEEEPFCMQDGLMPSQAPQSLELDNVSYDAPSFEGGALYGVSLRLEKGLLVGVFGEEKDGTGALALLLCGLLDPTDGAVRLDGVDVRELDRRAYYERLSAVLRNTSVDDLTVEECVCAGRATDEKKLRDVLTSVKMDSFVEALPLGAKTPLGCGAFEGGVALSKGQLQRLLIARALYKEAPLWVMEEPLLSLDLLAQHSLYRKLCENACRGCAVLLSQQPSLMRCCDWIVVLKDGKVCEEGSHEELLHRKGYYARAVLENNGFYSEGRDPDSENG